MWNKLSHLVTPFTLYFLKWFSTLSTSMQCYLLHLSILEKAHCSSKVFVVICFQTLPSLIIIYCIKCMCKSLLVVSILVYSHLMCWNCFLCLIEHNVCMFLGKQCFVHFDVFQCCIIQRLLFHFGFSNLKLFNLDTTSIFLMDFLVFFPN